MSSLTEKQRIKQIIKDYKNRYPVARKNRQDKNLVGEFLERLTREAATNLGLKVYDWASGKGDRGIDAKLVADCFRAPLPFAIECMNGQFDYTEEYFRNLRNRIGQARIDSHHPIIICVDKKTNFQRFTGTFACNVEFIELGKQFHPNTTTYADYEKLKKQLLDKINRICMTERPQEMAEWQQRKHEEQEPREEKKALEALDEKRLKEMEQSEDFEETQEEDPIVLWEDDE